MGNVDRNGIEHMALELQAEVLVVGGGTGGVAAALAALRLNKRVILAETTEWIGGQLTAQAVPPDEHPWLDRERVGGTASYQRFRDGVRAYYREYYPLTDIARSDAYLNPGMGNVSPLCHEPRVALAVLEGMLAPFRSAHQLEVLYQMQPVAAETDGDVVSAVTFQRVDGERVVISAPFIIDATEWGDLLELARVEHVVGAESQTQTGEPHARTDRPDPRDQQAISWCFAMDYLPGENHTIDRPADYGYWREYQAGFWPARQLSWTTTDPVSLEPVTRPLFIEPREARTGTDLWHFRRIAYTGNLLPGALRSDIVVVNWPQIDYWLGPVVGVTPEERERHLRGAQQLSLSLLYWMQTEAPRPDGGTGYPGLRLRGDIMDTPSGLAKHVYVRESRRILAEFTVCEQHIGVEARGAAQGAELFDDSVGIGSYRIDLHPSAAGRTYLDITTWPFQIPLGAFVPRRVENLLPGGKNLGVTHITNGCYRLHPVEWNIGEAAGALAAFCLDHNLSPRAVRQSANSLEAFQTVLREGLGIALAWPDTIRLQPRVKSDPLGI